MRAAVYHGRQDLRLEEVPEPVAGPGEVKLDHRRRFVL
jgi:(R,R)-butanediol dehydrogenase/meso-butanediol dehydrogenase/diacetyl reductase